MYSDTKDKNLLIGFIILYIHMWYLTLEKETPIPEENKNSDDDACGSLKNSRTLPIRIWLAFLLDA